MTPFYDKDGIRLYLGDCLSVVPGLDSDSVDAVITDPPYLSGDAVPVRGRGVSARIEDTFSVGMPWGYSLDWVEVCERLNPQQWVVYANYKMLGGLCSRLDPQAVFVWWKSNAPRMTRPVPRMDCEFIVWSRTGGKCGLMGSFDSMILNVPMPQAGCMASERILNGKTGKAAHPCQKPIAVVEPFVERLPVTSILDPYAGTGTTLLAAWNHNRQAIGIEINEEFAEIAAKRLDSAISQGRLFRPEPVKETQRSMFGDDP